jgi:hypothetical protein
MFKKLFFIFGSIFITSNSHADIAYIYCATSEMNWNWLKEMGDYITVSGVWKSGQIGSNRFHYFKLTDNTNVANLQKKCVKQFGEAYIFAQPADETATDWNLFGSDEKNLSSGVIRYCSTSISQTLIFSKSFCFFSGYR